MFASVRNRSQSVRECRASLAVEMVGLRVTMVAKRRTGMKGGGCLVEKRRTVVVSGEKRERSGEERGEKREERG